MSAPAKVSEQEIRETLKVWRGNVAGAAHALAISETALRKRMKALGIEGSALSFLRASAALHQPHPTITPTTQPMAMAILNRSPKNAGPNYPRLVEEPSLTNVEGAEAVVTRRPQTKLVRLRPDQIDVLRDAKFDYQAKHRQETEESDLLQHFFDESFPEWLKRALATREVR